MTQWAPGQSGNPAGRPRKAQSMEAALAAALRHKGRDGRTNRVAVAEQLVQLAREGNLRAIEYIFERTDGKVADRHEVSGPEGEVMRLVITHVGGEAGDGPSVFDH